MEFIKNQSYVSLSDIQKAQQVIADYIYQTPLITSTSFGDQLGINLHFKTEVFQKTGSFKIRGALNKLKNLTSEEKDKGLIAFSAGNHAMGVAYAASLLGIDFTVLMPKKAFKNKIKTTQDYGAEVILLDDFKTLKTRLSELIETRGLTLIHPFDDPFIIAGQGTIGLEILKDLSTIPDYVIVPVGGGGLISGIATSLKLTNPKIKVVGVEPEGADAMSQSIKQNKVVILDKLDTIADGLAAPFAGEYTLAHVKKYVDNIVLVSDDEIIEALRKLLDQGNILAEPAGVAGFAALLSNKIHIPKQSQVVCVLSGGNVDNSLLKEVL